MEVEELEQWIGICMYMSLIKLPRTRYYWKKDNSIKDVSEYMTMRRWETIKSYIHFSNNDEEPEKGDPNYDRIYKVRPFVELINERFMNIPFTEHLCIDEQMVPYSGTRGPRYYVKGKPNPWGFKIWALADTHGVIYRTDICTGAIPVQDGHPDIGPTGNLVLKMASHIPDAGHKLYLDNYFIILAVLFELLKKGIHVMGTIRLARVSGIHPILITDYALKKKVSPRMLSMRGNWGKEPQEH